MAIDSGNASFPPSVSGGASRHEREQEKVLGELLRRAREHGLANGGLLLDLFQALPAAAVASERTEYERIVKRYGKDHPRAQELGRSVDALQRAEAQVARGRARAARAMEAARMARRAFHGFVTDEAGDPLPGMTVRVASARLEAEARTAPDGYFRMELPEPAAKEPGAAESYVGRVTVVDGKGNPVHDDPLPMTLGAGSAYREYRVAPVGGAPGGKEVPRPPKAAAPRAKARKRR